MAAYALHEGILDLSSETKLHTVRVPHDQHVCCAFVVEHRDRKFALATDLGSMPKPFWISPKPQISWPLNSTTAPTCWPLSGRPAFLIDRIAGNTGTSPTNRVCGGRASDQHQSKLQCHCVVAPVGQNRNHPHAIENLFWREHLPHLMPNWHIASRNETTGRSARDEKRRFFSRARRRLFAAGPSLSHPSENDPLALPLQRRGRSWHAPAQVRQAPTAHGRICSAPHHSVAGRPDGHARMGVGIGRWGGPNQDGGIRLGPPRQRRTRSQQGSRMGNTHGSLRGIKFDHRHFKPDVPIPHQPRPPRELRPFQSNFDGMHGIHQTGGHRLLRPDRPKFFGPLPDAP